MRKPHKRSKKLKPFLSHQTTAKEQRDKIRSEHYQWLKEGGMDPDHGLIQSGLEEPYDALRRFDEDLASSGYDPDTEELWEFSDGLSVSGLAVVAGGEIVDIVSELIICVDVFNED